MIPELLRIVYLIGELGLGGSERQLYLLLKHMDGKRFERHVVVFNLSPNYTLDEDMRQAGIIVHNLPPQCKNKSCRTLWLYLLLRKVRPHILHSWTIHDNVYAGVVGALARVPRRLGSVRGELQFYQFSPLIRWLILHGVQSQLVNSESIASELRAVGVPIKRIHVLPNCVEIGLLQKSVTLDGIPPNGRLVGMVANLRWQKNHILFIRGMAKVLSEFLNVYGVMIGQPILESDPDIPSRIQSEIIAQGIQGRVLMDGFRANVPEILPSFEIFCLTSDSEGTPNAILEAMAAGLPVIATRVGGIPDLVQDGVTGLLIEAGDVDGLGMALHALLSQPEKARKMGMAGRTRIEKEFSCDKIVRDFEEYYLSIWRMKRDI